MSPSVECGAHFSSTSSGEPKAMHKYEPNVIASGSVASIYVISLQGSIEEVSPIMSLASSATGGICRVRFTCMTILVIRLMLLTCPGWRKMQDGWTCATDDHCERLTVAVGLTKL